MHEFDVYQWFAKVKIYKNPYSQYKTQMKHKPTNHLQIARLFP